ncbi:MAG: zinc metalloprotease HtpX [Hydrogenophilales bacterium 16-64-46]|nr:MAG: zinc metalloprotease HtpX [Hydrogenophilales bacterium 12-64-13]OYZ05257.1 MAG: zinc metalloprotease HtpX [Hydrogenophilales bacterium 16-64-46]OZA37071.1 MAG: zinc metalloprotease HtpX [Hydrogenophilales bacterium 17-64-34]HQT01300.1 protease HtpX [Thiobacillus sp.]
MKRIFLFLATNFAIVLVLSVTMRLLGVEPYLTANGLNLTSLLIFAAVMGFGGSLISLAISKWMAKKSMGVRVIDTPSSSTELWLVDTVKKYAADAGIGMPEVGIFDSPEVNAFATGMNKNNALVAVSSGLLSAMTKQEAEAVIGHEIAHVANGDMVTLALIQGVVNTFVMFLSRVIGHTVDRVVFKNENGHGPAFFVTMIVAELILGVLASIIVMWFSRQREFRADRGGASLAGKGAMIAALQRLQLAHSGPLPEKMAAFGIAGGSPQGWKRLFMTHPPLEERIAALREIKG